MTRIQIYIRYHYGLRFAGLMVFLLTSAFLLLHGLSMQEKLSALKSKKIGVQQLVPRDLTVIHSLSHWWHQGVHQRLDYPSDAAMLTALSGIKGLSLQQEIQVTRPPTMPSHCAYRRLSYRLPFPSLLKLLRALSHLAPSYYLGSLSIKHRVDDLELDLLLGKCDVV